MNEPSVSKWGIDCSGLHKIGVVLRVSTSNSLKNFLIEQLSSGAIAVPAVVWQELEEVYEEDAEVLKPHIKKKIILNKRKYTVGAAAIADKLKADFSRGPYDRNSDLYAAAICSAEKYTLLTAEPNVPYFEQMQCCDVKDVVSWTHENSSLDDDSEADAAKQLADLLGTDEDEPVETG
jgi:hypothetical protein